MVQRLRNVIHGENSIKGATAVLMVTLFLSNILGFLRDRFLASRIPAAEIDIYFNAFRLPDLVFNVLILGAITTAFIPVFSDYLFQKKQDAEAWRLANTVINIAILSLLVLLVLLYILMPTIIPIISPFKEAERVTQTVGIARLLLIQPFFFGLSYIAGAMLNSFKRFVAYATAPLVYNFSIIIGILVLSPTFGINGVVAGVILGALLHFLIQVPTLFSLGFKYQAIIDLKTPGLQKIGKLMLPRTVQLLLAQIILLAFARAAAQLPIGSASGLNFADNIQTVPTVIFGNAFALASFPYLSEAFSSDKMHDFNRYLIRSTKVALFFLLPSAVGLYLLRAQIVRLILGTGHFGWEQTILTADALGMFAIGLVALGLLPMYSRAFFAMHDTKTPMLVALPTTFLTIALGYVLAFNFNMGIGGLALAYSFSSVTQLALLYGLLRRKIMVQYEKELLVSIATYLALAAVMGIGIQATKEVVGSYTDLRFGINVLYQAGLGVVVGALIYLGLAIAFKVGDVSVLWQKKKIFTEN